MTPLNTFNSESFSVYFEHSVSDGMNCQFIHVDAVKLLHSLRVLSLSKQQFAQQ